MNSIKLKSNKEGFEIEIQTEEPQTPKQMADAMIDVFKAAPPPRVSQVIDVKEHTALPSPEPTDDSADAGVRARSRKRKIFAKNGGESVAKEPTAVDRIEELILAGSFETPQKLGQVQLELERKALHYSQPRIANALAELVRKRRLDRIGAKKGYKYVRAGSYQSDQTSEPSVTRSIAVQSTTDQELVRAANVQTLDALQAQH